MRRSVRVLGKLLASVLLLWLLAVWVTGVSPVLANELLHRASLDTATDVAACDDAGFLRLQVAFARGVYRRSQHLGEQVEADGAHVAVLFRA